MKNRPDLAELEVNLPTSFIGNLIYPNESRNEKAGNVTYMPVVADVAAQTNRTDGTAPDATKIATASKAYTTSEIIKRFTLSYTEMDAIGNVEKAEQMGAKAAKRTVMKALETAKATKLFTGTPVEYVAGKLLSNIKDGVKSIKRYSGETALVLSFEAYNAICAMTEITGKLSYQGFNFKKEADVLSLQPDVLLAMLQGLFGVSKILIGDDDCWVEESKAVVCKLPNPEFMSYKAEPQLGRTITYLKDSEFELGVHEDDDKMNHVFTAISYAGVVEFNAGAKVVIDLAETDESNSK